MIDKSVIDWLLEGDPSIRWQTHAYLIKSDSELIKKERKRVKEEGWGKRLLDLQDAEGTWAQSIYSPKWISTTYTMLLLRHLGLSENHPAAMTASKILLEKGFFKDNGINYFASMNVSETCVSGMVLLLLAYFNYQDERIHKIAEHLLTQQMDDGGWNCRKYLGATHSSMQTTITVLEALHEYRLRFPGLKGSVDLPISKGKEFLLTHKMYKSDKTGRVIKPEMTRLSFPPRWRYDILRGLEFFADSNSVYDERMDDAFELLIKKRLNNGKWKLQQRYPGRTYFEMEKVGEESRWNTLRALRVLKWREEE